MGKKRSVTLSLPWHTTMLRSYFDIRLSSCSITLILCYSVNVLICSSIAFALVTILLSYYATIYYILCYFTTILLRYSVTYYFATPLLYYMQLRHTMTILLYYLIAVVLFHYDTPLLLMTNTKLPSHYITTATLSYRRCNRCYYYNYALLLL